MAIPGTGNQVSIKDILDEKQQGTTARTNVSLKGLSVDGVADSSGGDIAGTPDGNAPYGISEFHDYAQASFNGQGVGSSTFSFTSGVHPVTNGHPDFDMNINGSDRPANFWEMQHTKTNNNSPAVQANATGAIRIGRDITNNRIIMLLLKDGDNSTLAGGANGSTAGYKILPYVGLGSATWTFKIEYDTTSFNYNSTTGNPKVFRGNPTGQGTETTSSTYHSVPSSPGTFRSMLSFTGMAENGESLFQDGSSTLLSWFAKVPSNENNIQVSLGRNAFGTGSIPCRLVIKAVNGSDTYTATSNYWNIGLTATRGFGF